MLIELRNGTTVDVPDPRERYLERMREANRHGHWRFQFNADGVPVCARWYMPIVDAPAPLEKDGEQ